MLLRCIKLVILASLFTSLAHADGPTPPPLRVREQDGSPDVRPVFDIKVSNGTLTNEGSGVVSLTTSGGSGTPGGTDRDLQFNDGGSFGGDRTIQFYKTTNTLVISRDSGQSFQPAILISGDSNNSLASISHDGGASFNSMTLRNALSADSGGTGQSTFSLGDLLQGNSSSSISKVTIGSMGQILSSDTAAGIKWVTGITSPDVQSGVFSVPRGGTGYSSYTKGDLLLGVTTNTSLNKLAIGSMGQILSVDTGSTTGAKWVTGVVTTDVNTAGIFGSNMGGTGQSSYALGDLLKGTTTGLTKVPTGSMGQLLSADTAAGFKWVTGVVTTDVKAGVFGSNRGGTGQSSYALGDLLQGTSTGLRKVSVGSMGQILSADTAAGIKWVSAPGGSSAAGKNRDIQFNNAGSFGGDTVFQWYSSPNTLSISRDSGQAGSAIIISGDTNNVLANISHDGSAFLANVGVGSRISMDGTTGNISAVGFNVNSATSTNRNILYRTSNSTRWETQANSNAETGSNAGSNFAINRYSDAGAYLATPFWLLRSTNECGIAQTLYLANGDAYNQNGTKFVTSANGILSISGAGGTNNESLTFDFEKQSNKIGLTSSSGVNDIYYRGLNINISSDANNMVLAAISKDGGVTANSLRLTNRLSEDSGGTGNSSYTKGDILVASAATTLTKLNVGTDGTLLSADSTQTLGVKWVTVAQYKTFVNFPIQSAKLSSDGGCRIDGGATPYTMWRLLFQSQDATGGTGANVAMWQGRWDDNWQGRALTAKVHYLMISSDSDLPAGGKVGFGVSVWASTSGDGVSLINESYATENTASQQGPTTISADNVISIPITNTDSLAAGDWFMIKLRRLNSLANAMTGDAAVISFAVTE